MSEELRVTFATLKALADGDIENAMISMMPGGIEAQEKRGQLDFVASTTLPLEVNHGERAQFEAMGIVFGEPVDDLFCEAQLPEGWSKQPTAHSMWSNLLDDKGRRRGGIFYKAAFYDRRAFLNIVPRFATAVEPVSGYDDPNYRTSEWHCVVYDCDAIVWESEQRIPPQPGDVERHILMEWFDSKDSLYDLGRSWLDENYPDWKDATAHWD